MDTNFKNYSVIKQLLFSLLALTLLASCGRSTEKRSGDTNIVAGDTTNVAVLPAAGDDRQYLVKEGDQAPDFEMKLPDGSSVTLSSLRGKVVMLQFTASWCGVCRKEMPYIESRIWQRHKANPGFALYGIDRDEPAEKITELIEATRVTYPIGLDPNADIFGLYAEKEAGITRNIIINREGKIVMLTRLFEEEEFNRMVETIDRLLLD
ncbi:MAG: TlpA disulfide reductase family protein [Proteiniphilum sp.]|nr:TlpA disulfide reductase family protein [Proteiniphilum sp.]MDD4416258.1 TlpA disulfide reductase family protein [Proteiniphilum sp.]